MEEHAWVPTLPTPGVVADLVEDTTIVSDTIVVTKGGTVTAGVKAVNATGAGVAGVKVLFFVPDSATYRTVITDANGRASTTFTVDSLSSYGVPITGDASRGIVGNAVLDPGVWDGIGTIVPYVNVTAPVRLARLSPFQIISGANQTIVASVAASAIHVRLRDEFNRPVVNAALDASPQTSATAWAQMTVNGNATNIAATNTNGDASWNWTPGNRIGANLLRITVQTANGFSSVRPETTITVTQTVPPTAKLTMWRTDTVGTSIAAPPVGICRRIPVGVRFWVQLPGQPEVDLLGGTNAVTINRPSSVLRCPSTNADTVTALSSTQFTTIPITIGAGAGTTTVAGNVSGKTASVSFVGARVPTAFTFSDTLRLTYNVTQTSAITVTVRDTIGNTMNSMNLLTGSLGSGSPVAMSDSFPVYWTSATSYVTNGSGAFTVNGVKVAQVIEPSVKMFFMPTSTVPNVKRVLVPIKLTLPAGATMTFAATPPATVLQNGTWTVTVRSRVPVPSTPMTQMEVTAVRTSGPSSILTQTGYASGPNGDAVFTYNFNVKGTYTFQFRSSYFPTLSTTVTVQ